MGHEVRIVTRTRGKAKTLFPVEKVLPIRREFVEKLPLERRFVEVESGMHLFQYNLKTIRKFQPIRYITPRDISLMAIPVVNISGFYVGQFPEAVIEYVDESDYVFADTELYVRIEEALPVEGKHIQYVHMPPRNLVPVKGKEPAHIWVNSSWTKRYVKKRWGVKSWKRTEVVNPPLYVDDYDPSPGFEQRPYDCVMFSRLGGDKFGPASFLNKRYKLLAMGSHIKTVGPRRVPDFVPEGELHKNLTMKEIVQLLGMAKVYVHGKGFGRLPPKSLAEHFGISICEAMACGCPVLVPRKGGCWSDVIDRGRYGIPYRSYKELDYWVKKLTTNKDEWERWHNLAIEGVQRFDAEKIRDRVGKLLSH